MSYTWPQKIASPLEEFRFQFYCLGYEIIGTPPVICMFMQHIQVNTFSKSQPV